MRLLAKDIGATALVAAAGVLYALWSTDSTLPAMSGTRVTGTAILVLGFLASAIAVVPGFEDLLGGSRIYLAVTSGLGLVAFIAAVQMLLTASETGLGVVMLVMTVLWLIATVHHSAVAHRTSGPRRHTPHAAGR